MSNYKLTKELILDGVEFNFKDIVIKEVRGQSLVMLAIPVNNEQQIKDSIYKTCALSIPNMGQSSTSADNTICLWRMQQNQVFVYFTYDKDDAEAYIKAKFQASAYYTDQSDTWAMISISGAKSRQALERICPLNLAHNVFSVGSVTRTNMEHIGSIIFHNSENSFIILVMRSFAKSMLHALEVSAKNIS